MYNFYSMIKNIELQNPNINCISFYKYNASIPIEMSLSFQSSSFL